MYVYVYVVLVSGGTVNVCCCFNLASRKRFVWLLDHVEKKNKNKIPEAGRALLSLENSYCGIANIFFKLYHQGSQGPLETCSQNGWRAPHHIRFYKY